MLVECWVRWWGGHSFWVIMYKSLVCFVNLPHNASKKGNYSVYGQNIENNKWLVIDKSLANERSGFIEIIYAQNKIKKWKKNLLKKKVYTQRLTQLMLPLNNILTIKIYRTVRQGKMGPGVPRVCPGLFAPFEKGNTVSPEIPAAPHTLHQVDTRENWLGSREACVGETENNN